MLRPLARLAVTLPLLICITGGTETIARASDIMSLPPLPHRASLPTEKNIDRHEQFMTRKEHLIKTGGTQLVFIGDSITDAWRGDPQREIFEDYFGQYRPYNIGIGGDETQHVLWRIQHGELDGISPKVVVLMIGTNNLGNGNRPMSPEETAEGITTLVTAIRQKLPASKILLLAVFPRGNRPDNPFRVLISQINTTIAQLDDGHYVKYMDIGPMFLDPDGTLPGAVMPDYLHPNPRGYEIWGQAIKSTVDGLEK